MDKKNEKNTNLNELTLDDLEKVTGGSLKNTTKKEPKPISPDTQKNI